jgi:amicyanin
MKSNLLFAVLAAFGTSAFGAAALSPTAAAHGAPSAAVVRIANFTFQQPTIVVKPGSTVTWVNDDDIPHTVTADDKSFKSKVLDSGERFSFTFAHAGEFGYFCSLHPHMTGKVVVRV